MNFCKAGTLLSALQIVASSLVSRRSSTSRNTTLSGFVLAADVMVNESPIPPATRLNIVVGLFTSCTMFNVRPAAWQAASTRSCKGGATGRGNQTNGSLSDREVSLACF